MRCSPLARAGLALALVPSLRAQHGDAAPYTPRVLDAGDAPRKALAGFEPTAGFRVEAIAAEPMLANPVAFHCGADGRIYVVETHRLKAGVIDMREYRAWLEQDLSCETVADRVAEIREHFRAELPAWRADSERVRCLIDDDGDGRPDRAKVFADGFDELADGIAAGVLADGEDVWFTDIPNLWKLTDRDHDGVAEARRAVHQGFGVHFSLIGHDMHGLRIGPDRRLYFSIGDRGFHVEGPGEVLHHPHEGAVLRCELDGSHLEVVHRGLRNPQELAFDAHGDLFTGDNNSDGGDQARWVQVVDGGDSGWTIGFQWLPTRGAWNEEGWWKPRHDGQPAFLVPPIRNIANGPSGLTWYPGTGLPARYDDTFFLCDFRGTPSISGVLSVRLREAGASFEIADEQRFLWKVLCTDVDFGPKGGLYVLDWVEGWGLTGRGRIWRTFDPALEDDPAIADTARILREGMAGRSEPELAALLAHRDQRVRQAAEFALCDRGEAGAGALGAIASGSGATLARLHAIWGLGFLGRQRDPGVLDRVVTLLDDGDAEVRAQAARVVGDAAFRPAREALQARLTDEAARVRFFAAQALGRIGDPAACAPLLALLRRNDDRDAYERHAAVTALARIGARDAVLAAASDRSNAVRMGCLLVLRLWEDPAIARSVTDPAPTLRLEAARAIHDRRIRGALDALGALSETPGLTDAPLLRRVLGAHRILGTSSNARALVDYAVRADAPEAMRVEALQILAEWRRPHGQDRVLGEWRPLPSRNTMVARVALRDALPALCADAPAAVVRALCDAIERLDVPGAAAPLAAVVATTSRDAATRARALDALGVVGDLEARRRAATAIAATDPLPLRRAARGVLAELDPAALVPILASLARDDAVDVAERRGALETLAGLQAEGVDAALAAAVTGLADGTLPKALWLDALEAALARRSGPASERATAWLAAAAASGAVTEPFAPCREGGDAAAGERVFREHPAAQCIRCHTLGGQGGAAAPVLDGVGARRDRDYLLRALIEPGADIADGFAQVTITREDGAVVVGVVKREDAERVVLIDADAREVTVARRDVAARDSGGSSMPPMGPVLTRRELRDVIEFLATRR